MFKLNAKFDADSLPYFYLLSHFECTVHNLTQWCLPPPLTSTVKLSLFTHVHSSPLSLARLHQCRTSAGEGELKDNFKALKLGDYKKFNTIDLEESLGKGYLKKRKNEFVLLVLS